MSKQALFDQILAAYRAQADRLSLAARSAASGATSDQVKSEGKYDTRSVEASYLAAGQGEQAGEATKGVALLEGFTLHDFTAADTIRAGALVEADLNGSLGYFFLLPAGGGISCDYDGFTAEVLTPEAPLYQALLGKKTGDLVLDDAALVLDVL